MSKVPVAQILLLSSSKVHGYAFLECAKEEITKLLERNKVSTVLFIPYALRDHDKYLKTVEEPLKRWGYNVNGIHNGDPIESIKGAEAIFIGGGNTFRLLKTLYDKELLDVIRKRVLNDGIPYIGSSAGTNVATRSIHTTNDMPIVYPPSFNALNLVPFNINPHYLDPDPNSIHNGETREERILQYHEESDAGPVLGLREGCCLVVNGSELTFRGLHKLRIFIPNSEPQEIEPGTDLSFLLQ